jgi:hypothetical protein
MADQVCIDVLRKAIGEGVRINEDKLVAHVERLVARHRRRGTPDLHEAVMGDIRQIQKETEIAAILAKRNALFNKRVEIDGTRYMIDIWSDKPAQGLKAMVYGSEIPRLGAGQSVGRMQGARADAYVAALYSDLEKNQLWTEFRSGDLDKDIYRAMHKLHDNDTVFSGVEPKAVEIAKILHKHNEHARIEANKYGAAIGKVKGYVTSRAHDHLKIRADSEGWLAYMSEHLDMERTFDDLPVEQLDEALLNIRHDFMVNRHLKRDTAESTSNGMTGLGNLGKRLSHERVMHFKTPEAEFEYDQRFGTGNLAKAVNFNLMRMGRDTALLQKFGPNPTMNINQIVRNTLDHYKKRDPEKFEELNKLWSKMERDTWPQVTGENRAVESDLLAQANSINSSIQFTSSLGGAVLSMISDFGIVGSAFNYQGRSFLDGISTSFASLTKGMPKDAATRDALASMGYMADGIAGSVVARFAENDLLPGKVATGVQYFWKYSGIQAWPDAIKRGFNLSMSHWIALSADKNFGQLTSEMQRMFKRAGIGESEWNHVMRKSTVTPDVDGRALFVPEALKDIDDAAFAAILTDQGAMPTPARIRALRDELHTKSQTMFQDETIHAIVEGDLETRSFGPGGGAQQGTWANLIRSNVMMFKTFPVAVIQKAVMRQVIGQNEAGQFTASSAIGLAKLITSMTLLGYTSMVAKDLSKNRTPRDPTDPRTILAAMVQGGGAGLLGDFLFGQVRSRFGGGFITSMAGPLAGDIDKFMDVYGRMRAATFEGKDDQDVAANAAKLLISNTPFINLFYLRGTMDYFIFNEMNEYMNPGYLERTQQRMFRENEQTNLFPVQ